MPGGFLRRASACLTAPGRCGLLRESSAHGRTEPPAYAITRVMICGSLIRKWVTRRGAPRDGRSARSAVSQAHASLPLRGEKAGVDIPPAVRPRWRIYFRNPTSFRHGLPASPGPGSAGKELTIDIRFLFPYTLGQKSGVRGCAGWSNYATEEFCISSSFSEDALRIHKSFLANMRRRSETIFS